MTTTISPSLGHGALMTQQGVGSAPGYDAIDVRRMFEGVATEGIISSGSYAVTQRAAGTNMSVDIAANVGSGARVQGDAVTVQGLYFVPPASAAINETIAAAHATLPRNDLVVLEIKDHQHDASGSNVAQTRVVTGTATSGAASTDALGVNGTPTLPASAIPLAVVNVPATDTAITNSQINDRRTVATLPDTFLTSPTNAAYRSVFEVMFRVPASVATGAGAYIPTGGAVTPSGANTTGAAQSLFVPSFSAINGKTAKLRWRGGFAINDVNPGTACSMDLRQVTATAGASGNHAITVAATAPTGATTALSGFAANATGSFTGTDFDVPGPGGGSVTFCPCLATAGAFAANSSLLVHAQLELRYV